MSVRRLRGLAGARGGSTTIEFALSASALILVVVGILGVGLAFWTWQALEGAAIDTARCTAINASSCKTTAAAQSYAISAAATRGLAGMTTSEVTVTTGAGVCGSNATLSVVSVVLTYNFTAVKLPELGLPTSMSASACFPQVSSG